MAMNPIPLQDHTRPPPTHHRAAIVSIGDELAIGQSLDTNSRWISEQLTDRGIVIAEHRTLPDDADGMLAALRELAASTPLVVLTGGLGPTDDDLTRQTLASLLGEPLVEDEASLRALHARARSLGRALNDNNRRQALRPPSARSLENDRGTAPGLHARISIDDRTCDVYCLPGPPFEMKAMFGREIEPALNPPASAAIHTRTLRCYSIAESDAAGVLAELMHRDRNPLVGTTASSGVITVRIRFTGPARAAEAAIAGAESVVRERLGPHIYDDTDRSLAELALDLLRERGESLALAESCTGGMLASSLTAVPGSSAVFAGGFVCYSNEQKTHAVGVDTALLETHGAVSEPVARALALNTLARVTNAQHALAITGIAGPTGGSDAKPVGTVWVAHAARSPTLSEHGGHHLAVRLFRFPGDRGAIRRRAAQAALAMLAFRLQGIAWPRAFWEHTPET